MKQTKMVYKKNMKKRLENKVRKKMLGLYFQPNPESVSLMGGAAGTRPMVYFCGGFLWRRILVCSHMAASFQSGDAGGERLGVRRWDMALGKTVC